MEDHPDEEGSLLPATLALRVSAGYLAALEVPLLQGRYLEPHDHRQRTHAVVISAGMARRFFPGGGETGAIRYRSFSDLEISGTLPALSKDPKRYDKGEGIP